MSKEMRHKDPAAKLSRIEDNALDRHYMVGGANEDIPVYDSTNAKLVGKTPAEILAILLTVGDKEDVHPRLDYTRILGNSKPSLVTRGVVTGFSLPVYSSDQEELYLTVDTPDWYDESSDVICHVHCYIASANNAKKFKLQCEWEHFTIGTDLVPATSNTITAETTTGNDSQYQSYEVNMIIDYDIDAGDSIVREDEIQLRIRRIAASSAEITGEIVITEIGIVFTKSSLGGS